MVVVVWWSGAALQLRDLDDLPLLMEPWIAQSIRKSWRRISGHQSVTSSSRALGYAAGQCKHTTKSTSEWLKKNKMKVFEWPSQSPDLNPIEIPWRDLIQSFHAWKKPSNVAELKQFCKDERAKIPPQRCWKKTVIANAWLIAVVAKLLDLGVLFQEGPGRFGQLFSLNKLKHYFKTAFCIYSGYLFVTLKLVWWSK